ncbi:MAG: alkene reductase [Gemmatimonadota bacterium]
MSDRAATLFTPVRLARHTLPNRVVMAPMTRNRAGAGNAPVALNALYYAQCASAGLIVTEGSQVSPRGVGYPDTPGIHSGAQVEGWRRVTDAVHREGGHIFLQLWHVGRVSHPAVQADGGLPVAPSALAAEGALYTAAGPLPYPVPRGLETDEIPGVVEEFAEGARNALRAGFDGVELHGANGYLIDQFLRDGSNRRTDRYGGPVENRARFLLQVAAAVADVWGGDRVGVRFSPVSPYNGMRDSDPKGTFGWAAQALNRFGLAYLHLSEPVGTPESARVAPLVRQVFRGPLILNGGYDRASADAAIASGAADLVAFGTAFLANPDLPARLEEDAPLNTPDRATFYGGDARGYTDYPFRDGSIAAHAPRGAGAAAASV